MFYMTYLEYQCFENPHCYIEWFLSMSPFIPLSTRGEADMHPLGHSSGFTLGSQLAPGCDSLCYLDICCQCPPCFLLLAHRLFFGSLLRSRVGSAYTSAQSSKVLGREHWVTTFYQQRLKADVQTLLPPFFSKVNSGSHSIGFSGNLRRIGPHGPLS